MKIESLVCNMLQENCYVVSDETKECVIIDCGAFYEEERRALVEYIRNNDLKPVHLLATHGHLDHNFGNDTIFKEFGLKPEIAQADEAWITNCKEQAMKLYGMTLEMEMPEVGHFLSDKEKHIVAYHEVGHALVAALQKHTAPVQKITIIPRTSGALGYTMQVETGNHYLMTKEEMLDEIATLTGGRAAEEVVFNSITTGASNDIERATKMARAMITCYGMSDDFDMVALETVNNQYLGGDTSLACSSETQKNIDLQVVALVKQQHDKARKLLEEHRDKLDEIAGFLYKKETITGEEFMEILGKEDQPQAE